MTESFRRVRAISKSTFRESIRSKVLYAVVLFAVLVIAVSGIFGSVTIGDQVRVMKDFGLFSLSLFSVLYCVISGSTLLHKELAKKTILTILARPVRRWEFLAGKFFGMFFTAVVLLLLMATGLSIFLYLFEGSFDQRMLLAYYHIGLELLIVCAAVIFFSSIVVTPMLIGLFSFGIFLAGRSLDLLLYFLDEEIVVGFGATVIQAMYWSLPHLNSIHVSDALVYDVPLSELHTVWGTVYSVTYSLFLFLIAQKLFQRREVS
ncbi:ABC transporter permease [bacterium]|nr:ABC transporter permease [bacterium]